MNKSEIIKMASEMTREEFLNRNTKYMGGCPTAMQDGCSGGITLDEDAKEHCTPCWNTALSKIKDIKFKDEEEVIEQPKAYNIHNLLNDFKEGTEFQYMDLRYKIYCGALYYWYTEEQTPMWKKSIFTLKEILNMKFTKVEEPKLKPMTFEEAVHTKKNVKYEYEHLTEDSSGKSTTVKWKHNNFYSPNETIQNINECFPSYVSDIIINGTWFAEGVYE